MENQKTDDTKDVQTTKVEPQGGTIGTPLTGQQPINTQPPAQTTSPPEKKVDNVFGYEEGANVRLSGKVEKSPLNEGPATFGMDTFNIPSLEQQRAGFKVEKPHVLVMQYPGAFKYFNPKKDVQVEVEEGGQK